jgi:hypothetical protein
MPTAYNGAFAATSTTQWVANGDFGALVDGASLAGSARYFGHGAALSIAGTSGEVAVSTAAGEILLFDTNSLVLSKKINFRSGKLSLSADGGVLGASANTQAEELVLPDETLNFYSLPSGSLISSFPYQFGTGTQILFDYSLSASASTVGKVTGIYTNSNYVYTRAVTALTGGVSIWSDSEPSSLQVTDPVLLSPDGTLVAVYVGGRSATSTNIYRNGTLVTTIPGVAVGWLDNSRLLVNNYRSAGTGTVYNGAGVFSTAGLQVATSSIPELSGIQPITADLIYSPNRNAIYSLISGQAVWTGSSTIEPTLSAQHCGLDWCVAAAASGTSVAYQSGHVVLLESQ